MGNTEYKTSSAQRKASAKWDAKQSRLNLRMSPEDRERIDAHAHALGLSTSQFIVRAALAQIERDNSAE